MRIEGDAWLEYTKVVPEPIKRAMARMYAQIVETAGVNCHELHDAYENLFNELHKNLKPETAKEPTNGTTGRN